MTLKDDSSALLRRRALKAFIWTAGVTIALMSLMTVYFCVGGIEWGDWTIPDEEELCFEVRNVPDEDNAFLALQSLTNVCHLLTEEDVSLCVDGKTEYPDPMPDIRFVRYYGNRYDGDYEDDEMKIVRDARGNPEKARRILADNAAFFDAFHKALCCKGFWDKKEYVGEYRPFVVYDLPVCKVIVRCAQLVGFRTQIAFEQGDMAGSLSGICEMHALGQMVSTNAETLVSYLCGNLIKNMAYRKMCEAVTERKAPDEAIGRFVEMIDADEADAQLCWELAMKGELASRVKAIEFIFNRGADSFLDYWEGERYWSDAGEVRRIGLGKRILWKWPGFFEFCYHPGEMIYLQAEHYRLMMAHAEPQIAGAEWWRLLVPGGAGRIWADMVPDLEPYFIMPRFSRMRARLILASEKWRRAHGGENPPTLEALVPECLADVPSDPWSKSGEPMKYDAALGVVWSIGKKGDYDYRNVVEGRTSDSGDMAIDDDTSKNAFRIDAQPMNFRQ